MGRIGDGDVHAAYVEFRAKETDKVKYYVSFPFFYTYSFLFLICDTIILLYYTCYFPINTPSILHQYTSETIQFINDTIIFITTTNTIPYQCLSAQCIYCQSVRAKNTSRQRQHLLECPNYLSAMKEHNPDNPILHESINGTPAVTPSSTTKPAKKRDHDTMIGFQGDSSASRTFPIPKPVLERDFQMSVQLNPKISVGPGIWGQRNWVGYISGHWNGRWGKGTVVVCPIVRLSCPH